MRELFRTEEGQLAWKNPATDVDSRRLLGALIQAQPEKHLRLVLGGEGEILLESLLRRGWVAWREKKEEAVLAPTPAPTPTPVSSAPQAPSRPLTALPPTTPAAAPISALWPPVKPAPEVSSQDIEDSLDDFFRTIGR